MAWKGLETENDNNNNKKEKMKNCKNELSVVTYANLLANMQIDSGYVVVVTNGLIETESMESMARDLRHPYTPRTTVPGDHNANLFHGNISTAGKMSIRLSK